MSQILIGKMKDNSAHPTRNCDSKKINYALAVTAEKEIRPSIAHL